MLRSTHSSLRFILCLCLGAMVLSGCSAMPKSGPWAKEVEQGTSSVTMPGISIKRLDESLARSLAESRKISPFSEVFVSSAFRYRIKPGDILELSIWESPPNLLFGGMAIDPKSAALTSRVETLPMQVVMEDGKITMPFVGRVPVSGRSLYEVEQDIVTHLQGKANAPQVVARSVQSAASSVALLGDFTTNTLVPLTPKGEKLLDAVAMAGGVTQAVSRMSLQISRGDTTSVMPLDAVIQDPKQNISLLPGDVITALYQPNTFSILGAVTKNEEIPFEARGISLAQALSRAGGLLDTKADPGGVFVFRFEKMPLTGHLSEGGMVAGATTKPVVYQVDFTDAGAFFVTQLFPVEDKDIIYVANKPAVELEKFLRIVGAVASPAISGLNTYRIWSMD